MRTYSIVQVILLWCGHLSSSQKVCLNLTATCRMYMFISKRVITQGCKSFHCASVSLRKKKRIVVILGGTSCSSACDKRERLKLYFTCKETHTPLSMLRPSYFVLGMYSVTVKDAYFSTCVS